MYNVLVNLEFEWDEEKNAENIKKHGVTFEEASSVFESVPLEIFFDPDHSLGEERYIAFGFSSVGRVLMVVHCENAIGSTIRIISARKATRRERSALQQGKAR
jgi:uncharacterized protein